MTADLVASIQGRLLRYSREHGADHQYTLIRFANERLLYRLGESALRGSFALKGATLFYRWVREGHRATRDLDFLAAGEASEPAVLAAVRSILAVDGEDGLVFDTTSLALDRVPADGDDGGFRIRLSATLGTAVIPLQLDLSFSQEVTPALEEIELPTLLGMAAPRVLGYPKETVVAEKLEAIVSLGMFNSRLKDYFDLWFLSEHFDFDGAILTAAVQRTFANRKTELPEEPPAGLSHAFAADPGKRRDWGAFGSRTRAFSSPEPALDTVVARLTEFLWPVLQAARQGSATGAWTAGERWH